MAVNQSRSMNSDLSEGATDGKYKKIETAEKGGVVEPADLGNKQALNDQWYGIHEARTKVRPDGMIVRTTTAPRIF